jgi:hypothetical protein
LQATRLAPNCPIPAGGQAARSEHSLRPSSEEGYRLLKRLYEDARRSAFRVEQLVSEMLSSLELIK